MAETKNFYNEFLNKLKIFLAENEIDEDMQQMFFDTASIFNIKKTLKNKTDAEKAKHYKKLALDLFRRGSGDNDPVYDEETKDTGKSTDFLMSSVIPKLGLTTKKFYKLIASDDDDVSCDIDFIYQRMYRYWQSLSLKPYQKTMQIKDILKAMQSDYDCYVTKKAIVADNEFILNYSVNEVGANQ